MGLSLVGATEVGADANRVAKLGVAQIDFPEIGAVEVRVPNEDK